MANALYLQQFFTTQLSVVGGINNSQTTGIVSQALTGLDTSKPGIACLNWSSPLNTALAEWIEYTGINSTTKEFQGVQRGREGSAAKSHDNAVTIAFPISESHVNRLNDALLIDGSVTNILQGVIDEDSMATNSAVKVPTQQSVKAYVDAGAPLTAVPGTDVTVSGTRISLTAGENLAFGNIGYIKSDGKVWKADADAIATSSAIVMATATINADAAGTFLLLGIARNDAWNWTVGGLIYLSTTAGDMNQTAPSGADDVIQILGVATHANRMFFNPQLIQVEHV